jgi:hypothetical protein
MATGKAIMRCSPRHRLLVYPAKFGPAGRVRPFGWAVCAPCRPTMMATAKPTGRLLSAARELVYFDSQTGAMRQSNWGWRRCARCGRPTNDATAKPIWPSTTPRWARGMFYQSSNGQIVTQNWAGTAPRRCRPITTAMAEPTAPCSNRAAAPGYILRSPTAPPSEELGLEFDGPVP